MEMAACAPERTGLTPSTKRTGPLHRRDTGLPKTPVTPDGTRVSQTFVAPQQLMTAGLRPAHTSGTPGSRVSERSERPGIPRAHTQDRPVGTVLIVTNRVPHDGRHRSLPRSLPPGRLRAGTPLAD